MTVPVDFIALGRYGRAHGIKGYISVHSYTEPRDNILGYPEWYSWHNHVWQCLKRTEVKLTDKAVLVLIAGFDIREQVMQLSNVEIAVPKTALATLNVGEYYWHQLVGMQVVNQQGDLFGQVDEVFATGSNDVLVVTGVKKTLIPYLPERYIVSVNTVDNIITVNWDINF